LAWSAGYHPANRPAAALPGKAVGRAVAAGGGAP
jgi:hypothetical protein